MVAVAPVLHGLDTGGVTGTRPNSRAQHGTFYYDETLRRFLVFDANIGLYIPTDGGYYKGGQNLFDDFRVADAGATALINWDTADGGEAQAAPWALAAVTSGVARGLSGDEDTAETAVTSLTHSLSWQADNGGLIFQTKVKIDTVANSAFFVGFTDVLAGTTVEMPFSMSVVTLTSTATDAVGFLFDTASTNDFFHCVGVADDTEVTFVTSTVLPVGAAYNVLRLELTTTGQCVFKIDGTTIATIAACVTADVALTPVLAVNPRSAASRNLDADYVGCFDEG